MCDSAGPQTNVGHYTGNMTQEQWKNILYKMIIVRGHVYAAGKDVNAKKKNITCLSRQGKRLTVNETEHYYRPRDVYCCQIKTHLMTIHIVVINIHE